MKSLMILIAVAGLMAGCAKHRETGQGGSSYENGASMGTSTNSTTTSPGTGTPEKTTDQDPSPANPSK